MEERMLVTQALDERDFMAKKIMDKINAFKAVDYAKHNESKTCGGKKDRKEYEEETKSAYQQIMDLIIRYDKIEAAIVASNEAPGGNVTGYSDLSDIAAHVDLTQKLCPDAKTVAIVYCSAEPNSVIQGNQAEELYGAAGFTTVTLTATPNEGYKLVSLEISYVLDGIEHTETLTSTD